MQKFYFNGLENIRDMGVYVVNRIEYPNVDEIAEQEEVEGSPTGSLTIKTGNYKDSVFGLKLRIIDRDNVEERFKEVKRWLKRITDNRLTFDYEKCYKVKNIVLKPYTFNKISCDFEVEVVCEPHLKAFYSDFESVLNGDEIFNYGDTESHPKIKLALPSNISTVQIYFNGEGVQLDDVSEYVFIDSERQEVLDKNNRSISLKKTGGYPTLREGKNIITWNGNITKFEIMKNERWDC